MARKYFSLVCIIFVTVRNSHEIDNHEVRRKADHPLCTTNPKSDVEGNVST